MADTVFSKIIKGEIPGKFVYEDEHCVAIEDINPKAPVHVLVIPRRVIPMLAKAEPGDQALLGHLLLAVRKIAEQLGVADAFRVLINNGERAGMTVPHLHLHLLAGRVFTEAELADGEGAGKGASDGEGAGKGAGEAKR